ncbi:MAG: hypothetical protein OXF67_04130 [Cyanobacteria bacterium MAG CAR4_bin_6]|nr:hypothetical protein [Cyanobacteria bacterium MAG CAR4_bin_6]
MGRDFEVGSPGLQAGAHGEGAISGYAKVVAAQAGIQDHDMEQVRD